MIKHISVRVPWHDNKWNGCVCTCPQNNNYCKVLHNILEKIDVEKEEAAANEGWASLSPSDIPPCHTENGGFMSGDSYKRTFKHPYAWGETPHAKLLPTTLEISPYTFFGTPFRYMAKDSQEELKRRYPNMPEDENPPFNTAWVYGKDLQYKILEIFNSHIQAGSSLCVFYCKNANPIDENCARLIVGIGEVSKTYPVQSYKTTADYTYPFWDLRFEHSIRQDLKQSRGFLLPYQEYLDMTEEEIRGKTGKTRYEALDEIKLSLDKLDDNNRIFNELSYGCEYVSNHSMLIILNKAKECLEKVMHHNPVGGDWEYQTRWIDSQIAKVKEMIGPFPSFAETLNAMGVNYAFIIEQDLRNKGHCGVKDNPWEAFDKLMKGDITFNDAVYNADLKYYRDLWNNVTAKQLEVLHLLSRFELDSDTISQWWKARDRHDRLLENPYLISEECGQNGGVTTEMIDLGVIADVQMQGEWQPKPPSLVDTKIDKRRIRSMVVSQLRNKLQDGDTLLSEKELENHITASLAQENLQFPMEYLNSNKDFMEEKLLYVDLDGKCAIQLKEYYEIESFLKRIFAARAEKSVKSPLNEDWDKLVKESIDGYDEANPRSREAVEGQIKALKMFSSKRLSVLTGPAGTGKTTVVRAFLNSSQIKREGVLLLAPTGKARVRLGKMAAGVKAFTIAQFLTKQGFFDWGLMEAYVPEEADHKKYAQEKNVIIDECSMLTCKDFYVLLKTLDLGSINRVILIGDPYQLPPIGPGRVFADLCNFLSNNNKDAITQLSTVVRTIQTGDSDVLTLAAWFSGSKPPKDADGIFERIYKGELEKDLSVYTWTDERNLKETLRTVLEAELPEKQLPFKDRIRLSIGLDDFAGAASNPDVVEGFQVLSPVIHPTWGTSPINTYFQEWLYKERLSPDEKVYHTEIVPNFIYRGDKVIQLLNERRKGEISQTEQQLSNGQIGFVSYANKKTGAEVIFTGIPNDKFKYWPSISNDAEVKIDLAYAITIHKSQGSDFDTVLVVLPKSCRIMSRELIYTALTRAKSKMILLIQDNASWLMEYTKPEKSVLAKRNSNLFEESVREDAQKTPYIEGLIHTTEKGLLVRSKSEVVIANMLSERDISFAYEKMIEENGRRCIPDFSFEDAAGDIIIWEHLGMLNVPAYRQSWENKKKFYESIGYIEGENLFVTMDHPDGGIDSTEIKNIIDRICKLI